MKSMLLVAAVVALAPAMWGQGQIDDLGGCGTDATKFHVQAAEVNSANYKPDPPPSAKEARIFLVQDAGGQVNCFHLGCTTSRAGLDGVWIGANQGDSYFSFVVTPGKHHLCVNWQSKFGNESSHHALANFQADAGRTYYFRVRIWGNAGQAYMDLDAVNDDEGRYLVSRATQAVSQPDK
jgi:hypothetical protein